MALAMNLANRIPNYESNVYIYLSIQCIYTK